MAYKCIRDSTMCVHLSTTFVYGCTQAQELLCSHNIIGKVTTVTILLPTRTFTNGLAWMTTDCTNVKHLSYCICVGHECVLYLCVCECVCVCVYVCVCVCVCLCVCVFMWYQRILPHVSTRKSHVEDNASSLHPHHRQ